MVKEIFHLNIDHLSKCNILNIDKRIQNSTCIQNINCVSEYAVSNADDTGRYFIRILTTRQNECILESYNHRDNYTKIHKEQHTGI